MNTSLQLRVRQSENPTKGEIDLFVWADQDGKMFSLQPLVVNGDKPIEQGNGSFLDSIATISKEAAQVLLDDLFSAGIRPSKGRDVTSDLKAKDAHIAFAERTVEALIKCLPSSQQTP